jgi:hypothetical protein
MCEPMKMIKKDVVITLTGKGMTTFSSGGVATRPTSSANATWTMSLRRAYIGATATDTSPP